MMKLPSLVFFRQLERLQVRLWLLGISSDMKWQQSASCNSKAYSHSVLGGRVFILRSPILILFYALNSLCYCCDCFILPPVIYFLPPL